MSIINEPKIDCHCHVIDPVRFPYDPETPYRPSGQEIAPIDHFIRMMDLHDARHALLVGTNSGYGEDLRPVADAVARGEGRFKGMAVVSNDAAVSELAGLKSNGFVGVAFNAPFHGPALTVFAHDNLVAQDFSQRIPYGFVLDGATTRVPGLSLTEPSVDRRSAVAHIIVCRTVLLLAHEIPPMA